MNKFKQCTYTILLMVTCFIASPFIFHQIWKNSSEAKKSATEVRPPVVGTPGTSDTDVQTPDSSGADDPNSGQNPDGAKDPDGSQGEPAAPDAQPSDKPYNYVESDASYFGDALFIGDSRTVGIKEYGTLKNADYFCSVGLAASKINSETVNGKKFDQIIDEKQYRKVYIMLGINEVGNDFETTATAYRTIVEKIKVHQPNAIIYIQGNLHVSLAASTSVVNNDNINYLNSLLAGLADYNRVFYIDINEVYDDDHGDLTAEYTADGIHPLAEYYKQWCEWLCTKTVPIFVPGDAETTENAE